MALLRRRGGTPSVRDFREEMQRMWEDAFGNGPAGLETLSRRIPATDIYEEGDNLVLECELPGMEREDIEVDLEDNHLTISGEHATEEEEEKRNYYRAERSQQHFERTFTLPSSVDRDGIKAEFQQGVLKVSMPKTEEAKKKTVEIQ